MGQCERVSPAARWLRGWVAGVLSTWLAVLFHYAADVTGPDPLIVMVAVAVAGLVCVMLAGVRMSPVRLGVAVALSHGAYHGLFSLPCLGSAVAAASGGSLLGLGGHSHELVPVLPVVSAHEGQVGMIVGHLLAAVITFVVLRHGEASWWALVDVLRAQVCQLLALISPVVTFAPRVPRAGRFFHHPLRDFGLGRSTICLRGPPALMM